MVASVLSHPELQVIKQDSDFKRWIQGGILQYYRLLKAGKVVSEQGIICRLRKSPMISFQYAQLMNFL